MTSRQLYDGLLIELRKENAPNILLEDFNYFANKSINQYINKRYNIYDVNLQTTDDLRVLKATAVLTPRKVENTYDGLTNTGKMATYYVDLPADYLHLLNCICIYNVRKTYKCYNQGSTWRSAATRLTSDAYSQVLDNFWLKPSYKRPYYYIHNLTNKEGNSLPTNPIKEYEYNNSGTRSINIELGSDRGGTDVTKIPSVTKSSDTIKRDSDMPRSVELNSQNISLVERPAEVRVGNISTVRLEIRYGTDSTVFDLEHRLGDFGGYVYIDYIKAPLNIRLTQEELDYTEDYSLILEFPDYVCQEILNELVHIVMENVSDQRLQTHPVVSLSIANPAQALAPDAAGQSA